MLITFRGRTQKLFLFQEVEKKDVQSRKKIRASIFYTKNLLLSSQNDAMYTT